MLMRSSSGRVRSSRAAASGGADAGAGVCLDAGAGRVGIAGLSDAFAIVDPGKEGLRGGERERESLGKKYIFLGW